MRVMMALIAVLLAGCGPSPDAIAAAIAQTQAASTVTPTPPPTSDPQATVRAIRTDVAGTLQAVASATPARLGFQEEMSFAGTGPTTTEPFSLPDSTVRFVWSFVLDPNYAGQRNFIVKLWNSETSDWTTIANEIGTSEGQEIVSIRGGNNYMIEVEHGDGTWAIVVEIAR